MNEDFWRRLSDCGTPYQVKKGACISGHTGDSRAAYLLDEGICALTSINGKGEEQVYLYFSARRLIGFNQLFSSRAADSGEPQFTIMARTDCTLYRLPAEVLFRLMKTSLEFQEFLVETMADNYKEALIHFHRMKEESAAARLCRLLLDISTVKDGRKTVPGFFTYAELAKYLGTHAVTVSRIMAKLKQCGYISKIGRSVILEREDMLAELMMERMPLEY